MALYPTRSACDAAGSVYECGRADGAHDAVTNDVHRGRMQTWNGFDDGGAAAAGSVAAGSVAAGSVAAGSVVVGDDDCSAVVCRDGMATYGGMPRAVAVGGNGGDVGNDDVVLKEMGERV